MKDRNYRPGSYRITAQGIIIQELSPAKRELSPMNYHPGEKVLPPREISPREMGIITQLIFAQELSPSFAGIITHVTFFLLGNIIIDHHKIIFDNQIFFAFTTRKFF